MGIRFDSPGPSVVVTCTECPYWHAFAWGMEEARASADRHERNMHAERIQTRQRVAAHREKM